MSENTIIWADEAGEFELSDGSFGNPGCDECGQEDAVAYVNGAYLCESGCEDAGIAAWLLPWRGAFEDGYTPEDINDFGAFLMDKTGLELVCVWDYRDEWDFGGDSSFFFVVREDGLNRLHETGGTLGTWLFEADARTPGNPSEWLGDAVADQAVQTSGFNWLPAH